MKATKFFGLVALLLVSSAYAQSVGDVFFYNEPEEDEEPCETDVIESCINLEPDVCCETSTDFLAACVELQSQDEGGDTGILQAFSSQDEKQCAVFLEQALDRVCICPTGSAVISGAMITEEPEKEKRDCKRKRQADSYVVKIKGRAFALHKTRSSETYDKVKSMMKDRSVSRRSIKEYIEASGEAVEV